MITLYDIISELVPNINDKKNIDIEINDINIELLDYSYIIFEDLIKFMSNNLTITTLINYLETTNINKNINKKKLINSLKNNSINNETLLFISNYLNINIWIYYKENKILKLYYLEDYFDVNRSNLFLINDKNGYKRSVKELYNYNDKEFYNFIKEFIIIPIGLKENKKLINGINIINPIHLNTDNDMLIIIKHLKKIKEKFNIYL
jgi:hypothetical protein